MKNLKNLLLFNKFFIIVGIFLLLYVLFITKIIKYETKYDSNTHQITGKITSYSFNGDRLSLSIKGIEKTIAYYYFKSVEEKEYYFNNIHLGDTIIINGKIKFPSNNSIPNTFNYRNYLYNKKIYVTWNVDQIKVKNNNNLLYAIKDSLYKRAYRMNNSEYYLTFLFGDKTLLNSEDYNLFKTSGVAHLLAISRMHISLFIFILNKLLNRCSKYFKTVIIILFLLFYSFITNYSPSVLRAFLFYVLITINKYTDSNYNNMQILIFTGYILILLNPFLIYDIGFIYSFIVVGGIIYYADKIKGNYITKLFKTSLISFLFSLPITAILNYEINITSILFNIIYIPLISLIIFPMAIISYCIPLLQPLFSFLILFISSLNHLFIRISLLLVIPKVSLFLWLFYYFILLVMKYKLKVFILLIITIVIIKLYPVFVNYYQISFLDVGQGDSSLIVLPHNKNVTMIDTGGKVSYKKDLWSNYSKKYQLIDNTILYLKSLGINRINNLIITHGDYDHMGWSINLVNNFKVEKVIFNCGEYNDLEKELIKVLDKKKIKYYSCIKELNIDKNKLYFLQTREYDNENDFSNVIYTELDGYKFMFMGDASTTTEKEILNKYNLPGIDVLKVGHHGSKTSSSDGFINEINPNYSIISVGKNNRYGHPNKEVLDNLKNSKIYRTDQDGSIMFKIKNKKLKIETCSP